MNLQEIGKRILIVGGVVSLGAAGAFIAGMGSAPLGYGTVAFVGIVSIVLGLATARSRMKETVMETVTPDPELPPYNPPPGDEIDHKFYEMIELKHGMVENREEIEDRLESAVIRMIRQLEDCSVIEARAQLETGEWTDDEVAAEFFRGDDTVESDSGFEQFLSGGTHEEEFKRQVERTVDALAELGEMQFEGHTVSESTGRLGSILGRFRGEDEDDDIETNWNEAESSIESFAVDEPFVDLDTHATNRWVGVSGFALVALGLGAFLRLPGLLVVGSVAVGYAAYARATLEPETQNLVVERRLSDEDPQPGDEIQIEVTVRNEGGTILPDLRLVDVVPDPFVVTRGSPRLHTSLRPGSEDSFSYEVLVERGDYHWPLLAVARDFSGSVERESLVTPEERLVCKPALGAMVDMPVRAQTTQYSGDVETQRGGPGLEFHSVREYREGDPMNRINWKRYARTGEFATVNYRQEKAATITLLFDTRERAFSAEGPGKPHAVDLSVHAATDVFSSLYDAGNLVGVAAFDTVPCWLSPGAGSKHLERARMLFATHPALSPIPPNRDHIEGTYIDPMTHVRRQLPSNSQVFMFSPLADDYAAETARRLDSAGHLVTIISPDTTADRTVGQRLATIERHLRLGELREHGIRAIDWDPDDRLTLQFERAQARWA